MDVSIFSDPTKIGPGIWAKMHIDAILAITDSLKDAFIININGLCDNFKCKKCQGHFRKFIDTHPFKPYWNIKDVKGKDIGFFKWTWELHNQVNRFLKKYEPTLEEAYNFFDNPDVGACFNCGNDDSNKVVHNNKSDNDKIVHNNNKSDNDKVILNDRSEPISRTIPHILTRYLETGAIKPKPFGTTYVVKI